MSEPSEMMCCPLSPNDGDPPEFYNQEVIVARKAHRCTECNETIGKDSKYERTTGKWSGSVDTYRTCMSCVEIRDHFACGNGWLFGEIWENIESNFFPDMKAGGPCLQGLSPEAKGRLFERRLRWLEE